MVPQKPGGLEPGEVEEVREKEDRVLDLGFG